VLTSTILLIWGGVTNSDDQNAQNQSDDDSFYLLNLGTFDLFHVKTLQLIRASCLPVSREWTRIVVNGPGPGSRYYHTMTLVGSKLFAFGGRITKRRFNDIWALDLNCCTFAPRFSEPF
jgi:Galactose oxidase, central domain